MRRLAAVAATTAAVLGTIAPAAASEPRPVCHRVAVEENSGNGPDYSITLCGPTALPVRKIIIDGSLLPERHTLWRPVAFWYPAS